MQRSQFSNMKIVIVLALIYLSGVEAKSILRLTRIICEVSGKTIQGQPICMIKTYNKISYFSIRFNASRATPNVKMDATDYRKNSDGYTKMLGFTDVEICKMYLNIKNSSNPFFKSVLEDTLNRLDGNVFELCSVKEGEIRINNYTYATSNIWPAGDYKANYLFHDEFDKKIFNFTTFQRLFRK
jgi:hypothetical protein